MAFSNSLFSTSWIIIAGLSPLWSQSTEASNSLCSSHMERMVAVDGQPEAEKSLVDSQRNFRYMEHGDLGSRIDSIQLKDGKSVLSWTVHYRHESKSPLSNRAEFSGEIRGVSRVGSISVAERTTLWVLSGNNGVSTLTVLDLETGKATPSSKYFEALIPLAEKSSAWLEDLMKTINRPFVPSSEIRKGRQEVLNQLQIALASDPKARLIENLQDYRYIPTHNDEQTVRAILAGGKFFTFNDEGVPEHVYNLNGEIPHDVADVYWQEDRLVLVGNVDVAKNQIAISQMLLNPKSNGILGPAILTNVPLPKSNILGIDYFDGRFYMLAEQTNRVNKAPFKYKVFEILVADGSYETVFNFQSPFPITYFERNLMHDSNFREERHVRDFEIWNQDRSGTRFLRFFYNKKN